MGPRLPSVLNNLKDQTAEIVLWGGLVLVAVMLVGIVLLWLRRKYRNGGDTGPSTAFSIASLEQMRQRGEISDEEFKALRLRALGLSASPRTVEATSSEPPTGDDEQEAVE
jgi:hypothetical protein